MGIIDWSDLNDISTNNFEAFEAFNNGEKLPSSPATRLRGARSYKLRVSFASSKLTCSICI
jgi:hypothetical protein